MLIPEFLRSKAPHLRGCLLGLLAGALSVGATAQDFSKVEITTTEVTPGIYMLQGQGGNIGVSVGDDGVFVIDDQFAPLTDKILSAINKLSDKPVRFVINTHWHFDHTGGNENLGKGGAIIVAHDNVRKRMSKGQMMEAFNTEVPPAPKEALPVVTFDQGVTFHWNDETLEVVHPAPAHTDGDAVIYFQGANVVHAGDLFFNGFYPFIDAGSGGSMAGVIEGVAAILARIDDNTRVIPGHGPLSNKAELQSYHDMLKIIYGRVKALKGKGKSAAEVVAAKPTADFDEKWGGGFLKPDRWVEIIYTAI